MTILRRSFLKLGTALVGGAVIAQYAEPLIAIPAKRNLREWIEDRGDHYIVRVPDGKIFSREVLDKPAVFLLGQAATVRELVIRGFVNVMAPAGGMFTECDVDASGMSVGRSRTVMEISHSSDLYIEHCLLIGNEGSASLKYQPPTATP